MGINDYLTESKHFNPWISHTGEVTWVPILNFNTFFLIKVLNKLKIYQGTRNQNKY